MLSKSENEILTRTGLGTLMGNLYRRFWVPALLASELNGPDAPPVRVNLLSEQLIAFRDSDNKIGLLRAHCPHRRANLFWGRNEESGLRCAYHGWKFDVTGQCVDVPNCPEGEVLKSKVRTTAYPMLERGGILWAYMEPEDKMPPFPETEIFHVPAENRHVVKILTRCNMIQAQEGDIDSSHVPFLHSRVDGNPIPGMRANPNTFMDKHPRWFTAETDYGLMLSAQRNAGPTEFQWRVNQWLMPFCTMIAAIPGNPVFCQVRIPIDDETSWVFRMATSYDRPLTSEQRQLYAEGIVFPDVDPVSFSPAENLGNDYLIDRQEQRTGSFTGIRSNVAQDLAVVEDQQGPIADRSAELLTSSDKAIIALRKKLLASAKSLAEGVEPPEARNARAYRVRSGDFLLPRDVAVADGGRDILLVAARP